jgi:DNA-binding transcriptional LysR family regulator
VRLLNRDGRGVTLTLPGETLRDSFDAIFQRVEQALRITRDPAGYQSFKLPVGHIEDANLTFIPLALIRFQALYPDITVERHEMNTAQ